MKTLSTLLVVIFGLSFYSFGQGCAPEAIYNGEDFGLYPEGPMTRECSQTTATKTFVSIADTMVTIAFPPTPPSTLLDAYIEIGAYRILEISGLPPGFELNTDVMNSSTVESLFGVWLHQWEIVDIAEPTIGCISVSAETSDWDSAQGASPNSDNIYPIVLLVDWMPLSSNVGATIVSSQVWASEQGGLLGLFQLTFDLDVGSSSCSGLAVSTSVFSDNESVSGCDGSAFSQAIGGTPPYSYQYSSGSNTEEANALCPGVYSVSVTDAQANSETFEFAVASSEYVYVEPINFTPLDSIYAQYLTCIPDYEAPIDSFEITNVSIWGPLDDTLLVNWVVYQNGNEFEINDVLYTGVQNPPTPLLYSLSLYCPYGRSEPGIFQLFAGFGAELGIEEASNTIEIGVVPNPSNGLFQLNVPSKEVYQIELVDTKGSLVWRD